MEVAHSPEVHASRRSIGEIFTGMLNKQVSLDTDNSDRRKAAFGGKVKPGGKHMLARTSSSSGNGDLQMTPESPSLSGSSPSVDWIAAGQEAAMTHHWPGASPQLTSTPKLSRGIFSALLGKKKKKGINSPSSNNSPSLGASSRGSESPISHMVDSLPAVAGAEAQPFTPPCKSRSGSHDIATSFDSVYSTPLNLGAMQSLMLQYPGVYDGDTLDLNQVMRQENPGPFTPSLTHLMDATGPCMCEPDNPGQTAAEEPTIMLVSGAQLAQAGHTYGTPAALLDKRPEESSSRAATAPSPVSEVSSTADDAESRPATVQQNDVEEQSPGPTALAEATVNRVGSVMVQGSQSEAVSADDVQVGIHDDSKASTCVSQTGAEGVDDVGSLSAPAAAAKRSSKDAQTAAVDAATPAAQPTAVAGEPSSQHAASAAANDHCKLPVPGVFESDAGEVASDEQGSEPVSDQDTPHAAESEQQPAEALESEQQASAGYGSSTRTIHQNAEEDERQSVEAPTAEWPELEASLLDVPAAVDAPASDQLFKQAARSAEATEEHLIPAAAGDLSIDTVVDVETAPEASEVIGTHVLDPVAEQQVAATTAVWPKGADNHTELMPASNAAAPPVRQALAAEASADCTAETEPAATGSAQPDQKSTGDVTTELALDRQEVQKQQLVQEQQAQPQTQVIQQLGSGAVAEPMSVRAGDAAAAASAAQPQSSFEGLPPQPRFRAAKVSSSDMEAAEEQPVSAAAGPGAGEQYLDEQQLELNDLSTASLAPIAEESHSPTLAEEDSGPCSEADPAVTIYTSAGKLQAAESEPRHMFKSPLVPIAEAVAPAPVRSDSPEKQPPMPSPVRSSGSRKLRQTPMNHVRESMPLFLADPSRAMGSPVALEDESLDDQDMQQIGSRPAQHAAASNRLSLLSHGGAQRVAVGQFGGFASSLWKPVDSSLTSAGSPIPEESPSLAGSAGSSRSSTRLELEGDMSPLRPRQLSNSPTLGATAQATPAAGSVGARSPNLAATPCSTYSTPTLALNAHGAFEQTPNPPQTGLTNVSVGSAIRQVTPGCGLDLSPAVPDMPEPSPTLMLMPGGSGLTNTPGLMQGGGGDGTTPSLLDARAASPSAVFAARFVATPFRGALAALPMDAALAAPLVDSSPFQLSECGVDTVCLADEAQRVAANLAMAAGGFAASPAHTPDAKMPPSASPGSVASQGRSAAAAGSPTEELRDLHVIMLTKQLAEVQKKARDMEAENLRLKEQVEMYEFEKTELNSQEDMEKQARQYAEEQLEDMRVEMQQLIQARHAQAQQIVSMQQEYEARQRDAQMQYDMLNQEHARLAHTVAQLQDERNQVLDKLNLVDMQVTALRSSNADLSAAVEAEQQRCAELEAALAARERDLAEAGRCSVESQARLEKMMEQMIAANTAKEHARQKASDEAAKVAQLMAERQQVLAQQGVFDEQRKKYVALKQKYSEKSGQLKEFEQKLQAKEAENQELMNMCDQLLQQQEARRQ